jgi:hypothetical protein
MNEHSAGLELVRSAANQKLEIPLADDAIIRFKKDGGSVQGFAFLEDQFYGNGNTTLIYHHARRSDQEIHPASTIQSQAPEPFSSFLVHISPG